MVRMKGTTEEIDAGLATSSSGPGRNGACGTRPATSSSRGRRTRWTPKWRASWPMPAQQALRCGRSGRGTRPPPMSTRSRARRRGTWNRCVSRATAPPTSPRRSWRAPVPHRASASLRPRSGLGLRSLAPATGSSPGMNASASPATPSGDGTMGCRLACRARRRAHHCATRSRLDERWPAWRHRPPSRLGHAAPLRKPVARCDASHPTGVAVRSLGGLIIGE